MGRWWELPRPPRPHPLFLSQGLWSVGALPSVSYSNPGSQWAWPFLIGVGVKLSSMCTTPQLFHSHFPQRIPHTSRNSL